MCDKQMGMGSSCNSHIVVLSRRPQHGASVAGSRRFPRQFARCRLDFFCRQALSLHVSVLDLEIPNCGGSAFNATGGGIRCFVVADTGVRAHRHLCWVIHWRGSSICYWYGTVVDRRTSSPSTIPVKVRLVYAHLVSSCLWSWRSSLGGFIGTPTARPRRVSRVSTQSIWV